MNPLTVRVHIYVYAPPGKQFTSGVNPSIGERVKDVAITNREQLAHLLDKWILVDGIMCAITLSYDWQSNNLTARYALPDENTLSTIEELKLQGWKFFEERLKPYRLLRKE